MHVLFLPSWYPSTPDDIIGSFFREQALALQTSGCKVGVIAPAFRSLRKPLEALQLTREIRRDDDQGLPTYRASRINLTPRIWSINARNMVHITRQLYGAYTAQEGHPDVIHVHSALPAGIGAMDIRQRSGTPFVLSEHSTAFARGKISAQAKKLVQRVALGASARFAVSTPFAQLLEQTLGLPAQAFSVMPNMVDDAFLTHDISHPKARGFNFLHISLLDEKKNVPMLLQAFADKFRNRTEVSLTIAGDGPGRPSLEVLAAQLGIVDQVSFPGKLTRSAVRAALSQSDAFVLPSRFETFGVVLVEALAMGVPIIATRCGGPEDIVTDANGLLVPIDDMPALANAMAKFQQRRVHYDRQALRDDCRLRFGSRPTSKKWLEVYENVLANEGTGH